MTTSRDKAAVSDVFAQKGRGKLDGPTPEGYRALAEAGSTVFQCWWNIYGSQADCQVDFTGVRFKKAVAFNKLPMPLTGRFDGAVFPSSTSFKAVQFADKATFKDAQFLGRVEFDGCQFGGDATFARAVFEDEACFRESVFKKRLFFERVVVRSLMDFSGATFGGFTLFKSVEFAKPKEKQAELFAAGISRCVFSKASACGDFAISNGALPAKTAFNRFVGKGACTFDVKFEGGVTFDGARFAMGSVCRFTGATFLGSASFTGCYFGSVNCEGITFCGDAFFAHAKFFECSFENVHWKGAADFQDATFGESAEFSAAVFEKTANFSCGKDNGSGRIANARFQGAIFYGDALFSARQFAGTASFTSPEHGAAKFYVSPVFHSCSFPEEVDISEAEFLAWKPPQSRYNYRVLKRLMSEQHAGGAEAKFFRLELRAEEAALSKGSKRWLLCLYRWTSDYGESIARPVGWLLATTVASGLAYANAANLQWGWDESVTLNLLTFTAAKSLPVAGMDGTVKKLWDSFASVSPGCLGGFVLTEVLQKLLTLLWFFLIGLGLRNRLRLR